jgi:hypothetical protein
VFSPVRYFGKHLKLDPCSANPSDDNGGIKSSLFPCRKPLAPDEHRFHISDSSEKKLLRLWNCSRHRLALRNAIDDLEFS